MNDPQSDRLQRRLRIVVWGMLLLLVAGISAGFYVSGIPERQSRQFVREQISEIKAGKTDRMLINDEIEMDEFLSARRGLDDVATFGLWIEYASRVDEFLKQIADQRGLRQLVLHKTDVAAAGIESVAAIPDLQKLSIQCVRQGDGKGLNCLLNLHPHALVASLESLDSASKLDELRLCVEGVPDDEIEELRRRLPSCELTLEYGY